AEIDWGGEPPTPHIRDLQSHGTYVNGKQLLADMAEPLRDGDKIRLGPTFFMTYRNNTERLIPRDELTALGAGDFAVTPPKVVLESLFRRNVSGVLTISNPPEHGEIVLADGRAKHVTYGDLFGREAVEHIKSLRSGTYHFE